VPFRFSLDRYEGRPVVSKTEAESLAQRIRDAIRAGTFRGVSTGITSITSATNTPSDVSFEMCGRAFIERYSKERGKASWQDDEYMVKRLASFLAVDGRRLGEIPLQHLTEENLEAFVRQLTIEGRSASTRNHYVQLIRAMSRWAVRKGYRQTPLVGDDSDVIRRQRRRSVTGVSKAVKNRSSCGPQRRIFRPSSSRHWRPVAARASC